MYTEIRNELVSLVLRVHVKGCSEFEELSSGLNSRLKSQGGSLELVAMNCKAVFKEGVSCNSV